ncbi:MAG TPA: long-chain fatty acid--CoA ligase [Candidatus Bathyarchaeia archaeon]|nr:long-chain fatty acid--CoA ligase [Candidatus Bathyarchaeia archaeon]
MLPGLIMDMPLMVSSAIQYAATYHGETEVVARGVDGLIHRYNYAQAERRMKRLASALGRLGVKPGDRIGTLGWNTHRHFELFYGVSGSGGVLHPINPRLFADQIVYIVNHAEDGWLFIDEATLPLAEQLAPRLQSVKGFVLMAERAAMPERTPLGTLHCYEELLAAGSDGYTWPQFDERSASSICYTSGTTGDPKGVVYSHRSSVLVSMLFTEWVYRGGRNGALETLMSLAPLFHANGWYFPYVAPMTGSKMVLPGRNYEPAMLFELLDGERVTITAGVPTMWLMLSDWMEREGRKLPHLRAVYSAGTAAPQSLIEKFAAWGIEMSQLWGMTEALGLTTPSLHPGTLNLPPGQQQAQRMKAGGRAGFGAQLRIVDDADKPLPHDGVAVGHLRAKSPWISSGYFKGAGDALDREGWLKTGDVASIDRHGSIAIVDRSKDLIKSGGEWISSIALENAACGHPDVMQAAVIGAFHPKWQERPLLIVTRRPGSQLDREGLIEYLRPSVASWWLPDDVVFVTEMPMTATGKIHKLTLREQYRNHKLPTA